MVDIVQPEIYPAVTRKDAALMAIVCKCFITGLVQSILADNKGRYTLHTAV